MITVPTPIAIAGSGCVLASGWGVDSFWSAACESRSGIKPLRSLQFHSERVTAFGQIHYDDHQRCRQDLAKNLHRYCTPAVIWGVSAVRQALVEANLDPGADDLTYGLYCCQGGYTHPSLASYGELLHECRQDKGADMHHLARRILQERAQDPFLVLKSLSNILLGVVSLALKLECECNAYMQGVSGNLAALREACAALHSGRIDVAIIVGAGSELDALALSALVQAGTISANGSHTLRPFDVQGTGGIAGEGAAALVLRRREALGDEAQVLLQTMAAHVAINTLSLPDQQPDLLVCGGSGNPDKDRQLSHTLAQTGSAQITSGVPVTGLLSAAPSLADLILARCALLAQCVPPIAGLDQPVATNLSFVMGAAHSTKLNDCLVLNHDDNGFSAFYQLKYSDRASNA
ncbi:beta-ketoacyl synthase N-terminal-like domain-containing protein [Pseudomonas sp. AM4(2022)]|uniref:beta-ketoacyl synthase N-terminal-like domain-containing protein n=1 Tax=Pseudomonas sp. AM4(2022) TaxID=2983408 RepID=UPI002E802577|nr:beta-ketoacyl synthase N-terminal-like domain-containing protein [Pseudomonas sp. AM4(2022)]